MAISEELVVAIVGLLCIGIGYLTYFLNRYTDKVNMEIKKIGNEAERTLFENALKDFHDIVLKAVTYAEQVTVKELKEKTEDGKLTKNDIKEVSSEVLSSVLLNITPTTKDILNKNIKDLEKYAINAIETKVFDMKK